MDHGNTGNNLESLCISHYESWSRLKWPHNWTLVSLECKRIGFLANAGHLFDISVSLREVEERHNCGADLSNMQLVLNKLDLNHVFQRLVVRIYTGLVEGFRNSCPYTRMTAPITVAARSKAWSVFARSNAGIMGSNPTQGIDVYVRLFCVYVVLCVGSGFATAWSPIQGVLSTVYRIKKLEKRPRSNNVL
jgi:hypothetical protein